MTNSEPSGPKKTRRWVLIADRIADHTISIGGTLVIAAVLGMMVFLVYEVVPLFRDGKVTSHFEYDLPKKEPAVVALSMDDYKTVSASLSKTGKVAVRHVKTGVTLQSSELDFGGKKLTAFSKAIDGDHMAFGFSDGTVRLGRVTFESEILPSDQLPPDLKKLSEKDRTDGQSVFSVVPGNQIRKMTVKVQLADEIQVSETKSPITALGYQFSSFGERPRSTLATLDAQGVTTLSLAESKLNLFTRKIKTSVDKTLLPPLPSGVPATYALVNDVADAVYFAERSGRVYRYSLKDPEKPVLAETVDLIPKGVELTVFGFLLGDRSLVVGGSDGSLNIFFLLARNDANSSDGLTPVLARKLEPQGAAITGFSPSQRGKTFATSDSQGRIWIRHGTSQATLLRLDSGTHKPLEAFVMAPRLDGLLALGSGGRTNYWGLSIPHPETSLRSLFGKVWYEGYPEPSYTWQSTGATDAFEPKLSLVPLIFGTLKATFYSLLFAIPIALLAAIYTSEFLPARVSGKVKPIMEIMASLPSVVLGFVAALVLAPVVETWIASFILVFVVLPLTLVAAAYLWQLLPPYMALRLQGLPKFVLMFLVVGGGMFGAYRLGPLFERLFFNGNFKVWVSSGTGSSVPFLFLLLLPVSAIVVGLAASRIFGFKFGRYLRQLDMPYAALVDLLRWVGVTMAAVGFSYLAAVVLNLLGVDPRDGLVGTYVQRNTLVVGFAMGFAVIPIIYTLADDALSAVPEHLRSASLGCGATPWQTALWIVIPTALSGVFSAVMIGMGRAVGETMIVVMSAGNTPLLDLNVFNGLRALSANIAVELPEAPKDGTLYRVLFLTGLVLFGMTFVINTVAELVRLRFRKRAMQL